MGAEWLYFYFTKRKFGVKREIGDVSDGDCVAVSAAGAEGAELEDSACRASV